MDYKVRMWNKIIEYARSDSLEEDVRANAVDYLLHSYDARLVAKGGRYLQSIRTKYRHNKTYDSVFDDSQNVHDEYINSSNMASLIRLADWAEENIGL